jgi:excisionase family DNA binding protein
MERPPRYYSAKEIAETLGLHLRTVQVLLREGKIQGVKIGKLWKASQADIDAYVQAQREETERQRRQ